jgi:hypothetical protein
MFHRAIKLTSIAFLEDLFDNMYDLVDSLTFKLHHISPALWPVFELTYKLFKSDAIDFLEGKYFIRLSCQQKLDVFHSQRCFRPLITLCLTARKCSRLVPIIDT